MESDCSGKNDTSSTAIGVDDKISALDLIESELGEELRRAGVPASDKEKVRSAVIRLIQRHEFYSGPLPNAQQFQGYEDVCPGSANRILEMAEKEQTHRHSWEITQLSFEHS